MFYVAAASRSFVGGPRGEAYDSMEREWRLHGELRFDIHDVRRVFFPEAYAQRFRKEAPEYAGQVVFARPPAECG